MCKSLRDGRLRVCSRDSRTVERQLAVSQFNGRLTPCRSVVRALDPGFEPGTPSSDSELVPHPSHRANQGGFTAQLAPQGADVNIHVPINDGGLSARDPVQ